MAFPLIFVATAAGDVSPWLIVPFGLLLLLIATMPLTPPRARHLWERYYPHVSLGLAAVVAAWYLAQVPGGGILLAHALRDYVSFIVLIGSLFVVAGGIHLEVRGGAPPAANVAFLALGAVAANVIGTTGASMVLIRPWMRMNRARIGARHIVFFIFVVSNLGGALTPIGDPPLFLGFLRGVPFFWLVERVMGAWLFTLGLVLVVFYVCDRRGFRRQPAIEGGGAAGTWRVGGRVNLLFLSAIVGAVFLPERFFLREAVMLGAAVASCVATPRQVHRENAFTFGPLKEVAFLFAGIFATMLPALGYLEQQGAGFGLTRPLPYYFACGAVSSVLDNAPAYANFFQLAQATAIAAEPAAFAGLDGARLTRALLVAQPQLVIAVSLGAVFFGAMTYIGNGPNFMVRSIAQEAGVPCPTFFGYVFRYSLPILLPILALAGWLFL